MSNDAVRVPGWHKDEETGGTRYWDGSRWTGDVRPPRKPFAAAAAYRGWGLALIIIGAASILGMFSTDSPIAVLIAGLAIAAGGVYLYRGQGPTTKAVLNRLREERLRGLANTRPSPANNASTININVGSTNSGESAAAAQIQAISNPETAKSLQNLQNLLYTHAITDAEYEAAKRKLLGEH